MIESLPLEVDELLALRFGVVGSYSLSAALTVK
jgi:hypothetical protein